MSLPYIRVFAIFTYGGLYLKEIHSTSFFSTFVDLRSMDLVFSHAFASVVWVSKIFFRFAVRGIF